jgi:flagellar basal body-associated protein FliL
VTVPSPATIPAGLVSTSFSPAYGGTATLPCTTTVTASATDVTPDTVSITVNRPAAITVGGTVSVGAGLMDSASASVSAAQHGGLDVTITAGTEAQPGPVRLSRTSTEVGAQSITVHVNNGQTSIPYYVHGLENTTGSSTITLTAEGVTGASHTVAVVTPGVELLQLSPSLNTLSGADTDLYAQVGISHPSYNNAQLYQAQSVRAGSPGLEVTLTNSSSAVARLRSDEPAATGGQTGQVVKKTIPAGTYYTHAITTGTTYGLAFEPMGTGTTTVTVTVPGAVTMTSTGVRQVQITSPVINAGGTVSVGAGLMESVSGSLSAAQHGGVDVTITAGAGAQPGPVRLSRSPTEVGTQSITVHLNNGQSSFSYYVHGLEDTTGSSTIALTAERFTSDSHTAEVVPPGVELLQLSSSMNTLSGPDTDIYVQVGISHPSYNNAQLYQAQSVRPGGRGFEVTLTNSSSAVARLRSDEPAATGGQTGQVVRKTIPAGTYYTHAIATGTTYGLAFEPMGTGTTTVTVTAPGAVTMTSTGVRQVQVTSPVINAGGTVSVGAGLMDSASASLSAAQHGGVDVTITAGAGAQPGPVRLSRTPTEVGTQSITVHLNNGQSSFSYYVHGLENTTGSSTIALTAERFTSDSHTAEVVQPGVELHQLSASFTNLSADDTDLYVQVGITHPTYNNAQLWQVQNVRPGGTGFEVTLTNSNVNVARLRSDEPAATGGQTGQVVKKTIPAGTYYTHAIATGTTYGFAFEPLSNGSTTVTVTAPGALTMTSTGVRPVTVTTPAISVAATATIGAGLMDSLGATLGATQHGGVDVTITSSAPSVFLVSPNTTSTGTASTVVHVANGLTSVPFVIHGMENVSATAVVTLSAPGFTSTTMSVTVTPSSVEILNLSPTISAGAADDSDIYVQVGITHPSYNNSQLWQVQNVRAGSPGFVVTMTVDNPAMAQLRSDEPPATGQTVTKPIRPGIYYTQRVIQSGTTYGLAFDPLAQGTVVVTATGPPGTQPLDTSQRSVVINP